jgi:hypothetical protein
MKEKVAVGVRRGEDGDETVPEPPLCTRPAVVSDVHTLLHRAGVFRPNFEIKRGGPDLDRGRHSPTGMRIVFLPDVNLSCSDMRRRSCVAVSPYHLAGMSTPGWWVMSLSGLVLTRTCIGAKYSATRSRPSSRQGRGGGNQGAHL